MDDLMNDPRFPDRPEHPDFWRLVSAALKHDGDASESDKSIEEIIGELIDPASLLYMCEQRAAVMAQRMGLAPAGQAVVNAALIDGILTGIHYERHKP